MEFGTDLRMLLTAIGVFAVLIVVPFVSIEYDRRKKLREGRDTD